MAWAMSKTHAISADSHLRAELFVRYTFQKLLGSFPRPCRNSFSVTTHDPSIIRKHYQHVQRKSSPAKSPRDSLVMELPVQPTAHSSRRRNFEKAPWCYLLWGVPVVLVIGASAAYGASIISLTARGALWVIAVAWAGTGCLINGRSCGRVHCRIDGIFFPLLSIIGALNTLSVISFDWNLFWLAFIVILVGSFVPEWTWKKYS